MTEPYRPHIHSQADLEAAWRHLIRPLGFHRRSLWLLLIDRDQRPTPVMTEITDLPARPDPETMDGLGDLLGQLLVHVDPEGRWALLLSRPGRHPADRSDRMWAAGLYGLLRTNRIAHDVVHLATDTQIHPIPLDDVTDYLQAS